MSVALTSLLGFFVTPSVLIGSYLYYRACCRRTCHACWINAEQNERRGTDRGAVSSVLLPHTCPTARLLLRLRPAAVRNLVGQHFPKVVERYAQVGRKQVSATQSQPARLLRIVGEDTRDVRDRARRGERKVS